MSRHDVANGALPYIVLHWEDPREDTMLFEGTDPELHTTKHPLVHEEYRLLTLADTCVRARSRPCNTGVPRS